VRGGEKSSKQGATPAQIEGGGGGSGPWCQGEEGEGGGPSGMGAMCGGGVV
jgi:hypothetical protein